LSPKTVNDDFCIKMINDVMTENGRSPRESTQKPLFLHSFSQKRKVESTFDCYYFVHLLKQ